MEGVKVLVLSHPLYDPEDDNLDREIVGMNSRNILLDEEDLNDKMMKTVYEYLVNQSSKERKFILLPFLEDMMPKGWVDDFKHSFMKYASNEGELEILRDLCFDFVQCIECMMHDDEHDSNDTIDRRVSTIHNVSIQQIIMTEVEMENIIAHIQRAYRDELA